MASRTYNSGVPLFVIAWLAFVTIAQPPSAAQPAVDAVSRGRAAVAALTAQEFSKVEAEFDEKLKAAAPGRLAAMWTRLLVQGGAFKQCSVDSRLAAISDKQMVITACRFERATVDVQFAFDPSGRISGFAFRPVAPTGPPAVADTAPPYANPVSYDEQEATVGSGDWTLPATLAMPAGDGPFPAVVLVHGSGPNDRDETVGASKPFKDLALGLASRGIAVLRYDKRTKVHGGKMAARPGGTVKEEVIDDVVEAVKVLRARPRIDPARVVVLGHSLGGMLVPRIAAADPSIAGFVVLAGPARPLEEAIVGQMRHLAMADGTISPEERKAIDEAAAVGDRVRALKREDAQQSERIFGAPAAYWLDLRGYDPASAAKSVTRPMLILQGERDYQVTVEEFLKWKAALGSRSDVSFRSYPALNHLFIAGSGPMSPAEYQVPGHVAEEVVTDIANWVQRLGLR
jgi:dienelactone hydrolase